ncbi:unnamed protein product, partial [Caretta caretta]
LFFPRVNPLTATLSVILVVLFAFIGLTVYLFKMKGKRNIEIVNVTLDPDTAQSQLVLPEDGKSVRWGDTWQNLPDNPERFDSRACVLGYVLVKLGFKLGESSVWMSYCQQESQVTVKKMKVLSFCHSSRASSPLPGFIVFFLTSYVHKMESAKFTVIGPRDPVTAILGQETVLPCHLSPRMSAANMEVRWFRSAVSTIVHLYRDGKDQYEGQVPEYRGRTELLKAGLTDGNVHLRILNIRPSDEGQYHCFVQDGTFYEEAVLELRVAGLGSAPLISVEGHQDGGIRVVCRSAGWYPEPEVLWKDFNGQRLPSLSETKSRGDNNLFETETALIVTEHSNQNLSCCITNTVLNQDKESAVYIADLFFPRVNPLMATLSVILVVLFAFIGLTVYLFKMKAKLTEEVGKFQFPFFPQIQTLTKLHNCIYACWFLGFIFISVCLLGGGGLVCVTGWTISGPVWMFPKTLSP